jgi:hypothetical protein
MVKKVKKKFHQDITVHTPIEIPCRGYSKCAVFRHVYSKIRLKKRPNMPVLSPVASIAYQS